VARKSKARTKPATPSAARRQTKLTQNTQSGSVTLKPLVTDVRGACQLLGCSRDQIYALLHAGEIASYLDGRARRIVIASLRAYVTRRRQSSQQFEHARYPERSAKGAIAPA
jgi:excisionase family DNA binding protein